MGKKSEVLVVNNAPIKVVSWGDYLPSDIDRDPKNKPEDLILVVPGNPGVTAFYEDFLTRLHENTNKCVWILSHVGHDKNAKNRPPLVSNKDLYDLKGQIEQKRQFVEKYLKGIKVHCVGHSIGCKMILELLKGVNDDVDIHKCYLLFPTIERMAESPNGRVFAVVYRYLMGLIILGSFIFVHLPRFLQFLLIKGYLWLANIPQRNAPAVSELIHPYVLENVFFLADDELKTVRELDSSGIKSNFDKIKLYYGLTDGWVPFAYYEDMKKRHEGIDAQICTKGFQHAFVLRDALPMADVLSSWINS